MVLFARKICFFYCIFSQKYVAGSITVFGLSVKTQDVETLTFTGDLSKQKVDVYLMTPDGPDGLLSR